MLSAIVPGLVPLERVLIDAGTFEMGSQEFVEAKPVTLVNSSAFKVSRTKATVGQYCDDYLRALGRNRVTLAVTDPGTGRVDIVTRGRTEKSVLDRYWKSLSLRKKLSRGGVAELGRLHVFEVMTPKIPPKFRKSSKQPVNMISWWELAAFAAAHGGRLPTEAQCERIMRGRSGKDKFGTSTGQLMDEEGRKLAHYGERVTAQVGSYPENSWGVLDASGNLFNWTDTWWKNSYKGLDTKDPRGPKEGEFRVVRGGTYDSGEAGLHAANRYFYYPGGHPGLIGGIVVWPSQDSV